MQFYRQTKINRKQPARWISQPGDIGTLFLLLYINQFSYYFDCLGSFHHVYATPYVLTVTGK